LAGALAIASIAAPSRAWAQACCAGPSAITPGRLAPHEGHLLGSQTRVGVVLGSHDVNGHYRSSPPRTSEVDFGEDLFGAARIGRRLQLALLAPLVLTHRRARDTTDTGGGLGDVNLGARYDFHLAGQDPIVPGIALLAGLSLPTGKAPDAARQTLAADATGIGAFQGNLGASLEQTYGPWLVSASAFVGARTSRSVRTAQHAIHETLGPQLTSLAGLAYSFDMDRALAVIASFMVEGNATIDGHLAHGTARRVVAVTLAGVLPLAEAWHLQASVFVNPPISGLGKNFPASTGGALTVVVSAR
jgi:uncharacterized membrane protein (GlpM family)